MIIDDVDPQNIPEASNILQLLHEEFKNVEPGATLVLYMLGHGERSAFSYYNNNSGFVEYFLCGGPKDENEYIRVYKLYCENIIKW